MDLEEARKHLDLAKEQWESAACAAWAPEDAPGCVTNAFYAYENLIVAVAEAYGRTWEPNHYKKSKLAAELFLVNTQGQIVGCGEHLTQETGLPAEALSGVGRFRGDRITGPASLSPGLGRVVGSFGQ